MTETVLVRGEGGWEFEQDVPAEGTAQRELFDDAIAKGRLVIVSEVDRMDSEASTADYPSDGSIDAVVRWVRGGAEDIDPVQGWDERAAEALAAEIAKGKPRSALVKLLTPLVNPPAED